MSLTEGQLKALENLGRKRQGGDVPFVNIADARTLVSLGLAERGREGWTITSAGVSLLAENGLAPAAAPHAIRMEPVGGEEEVDRDEDILARWTLLRDLLLKELETRKLVDLGLEPTDPATAFSAPDEVQRRIMRFDALLRGEPAPE